MIIRSISKVDKVHLKPSKDSASEDGPNPSEDQRKSHEHIRTPPTITWTLPKVAEDHPITYTSNIDWMLYFSG